MSWVLAVNLVGGDEELANELWEPARLSYRALTAEASPEVGEGWAYWIPFGAAMILYVITIMASSLLRSSMGDEHKNRLLEIMMVSLNPFELLTGKIVALAFVGLLQTAVWAGTGYLLLRFSGTATTLPPAAAVPLSLLLWSLLFFLLGYGVYATLLAGLGAAAVALSLFPPTAPIAMITRLAVGGVPWWQPVLSALLLAVTVALILRAVARAFRTQVLLGGQPVTSRRYLALLLGRE